MNPLLLADAVPAIVALACVLLLRVVLLSVLACFPTCFLVPGFGIGAHGTLRGRIDIGYRALLFSGASILLLLGAESITSLLMGELAVVASVP